MKQGFAALATVVVIVLLAVVALKVVGAVIGFALKAALVVVLIGVGLVAYLAVQKRLGDWRAP